MKEPNCREIILYRLYDALANCPEGIPAYPDADEDDFLTSEQDITALTDEELVNCFEATYGFWG